MNLRAAGGGRGCGGRRVGTARESEGRRRGGRGHRGPSRAAAARWAVVVAAARCLARAAARPPRLPHSQDCGASCLTLAGGWGHALAHPGAGLEELPRVDGVLDALADGACCLLGHPQRGVGRRCLRVEARPVHASLGRRLGLLLDPVVNALGASSGGHCRSSENSRCTRCTRCGRRRSSTEQRVCQEASHAPAGCARRGPRKQRAADYGRCSNNGTPRRLCRAGPAVPKCSPMGRAGAHPGLGEAWRQARSRSHGGQGGRRCHRGGQGAGAVPVPGGV